MHPGEQDSGFGSILFGFILNTSMCLFSYISLTLANDRYFQYQLFDY